MYAAAIVSNNGHISIYYTYLYSWY